MSGPFPPGFDGPRDLPRGLRSRLVAEMGDAALVGALAQTATPRVMSPGLADRLEATLLGAGAASTGLSERLRQRLERTLIGRRAPAPLVVAAAVLLVLGTLALPFVGDRVQEDTPAASPAPRAEQVDGSEPSPARPGDQRMAGGSAGGAGGEHGSTQSTGPDEPAPAPSDGTGSPQAGRGGSGGANSGGGPEGAPPFAYSGAFSGPSPAQAAPPPPDGSPPTPEPPPPPLRVGIAGANTAVDAGFRAYVDLLNEQGGVEGRLLELVPTSAAAPAPDIVGVVNVGAEPIAGASGPPNWVTGPLLETLAVDDNALTGRVFSFGSVLERQAHVAVDAAFSGAAPPGTRGVVYRAEADGDYGDRVAEAFAGAIEAAGAIAAVVTVDPEAPVLVPADAAFVSMPTEPAASFLEAVSDAGYAPDHGIWGVASIFDEAIAESFSVDVRVASPFSPAFDPEVRALRDGSGTPVSAESAHGWVTAKALAVAVYQSDPDTADELVDALADLEGWETGFLPPYEVRPGTRSRTPEAMVLKVVDGAFAAIGDWRRDSV